MKKLSKDEMKKILGGMEESGGDTTKPKVICISCYSDSDCSFGRVCRTSPSCPPPIYDKVCARPIYV